MLSCTSEKSKLPALHRNPMSLAKSTSKLFQKACVREEDMITNMTDNETAPKKQLKRTKKKQFQGFQLNLKVGIDLQIFLSEQADE